MKKLYLFLLALGIGADTYAKPVNIAAAKAAGYNFMTGRAAVEGVAKAEDLQLVYTTHASNAQGTNCYYVFNLGTSGFVMVSADDQAKAILGYSTEGLFDPNDMPANATAWMQHYTDQIQYIIDHNISATGTVAEEWKMLLAGTTKGSQNKTTAVAPLTVTKWNQNPYYNALCPLDGTKNAVTGCVATTMAQLMKYWNYPVKGIGSHTYNHPDFGTLSANFASTTYDWSSMPNQLGSGSTNLQIQAVATLMYHAGVAVDMDYSVTGSGAQSLEYAPGVPSAEYALKAYFGYTTAHGLKRSNYTDAQWKLTITTELDNNRPVYYAGSDLSSGTGHAWVCDGYDNTADQNLHMNWGWNGMYNGYYHVDNLVPGTGGTGSGTGDFSDNQRAIVNIVPPGAIMPDNYENNNTISTASVVSAPSIANNKGGVSMDANFHNATDEDYYEVKTPATNHTYRVTARVHDKNNSGNGNTYTVDAQFAANTTKLSLNSYNDVSLASPITVAGNYSVYFKVVPMTAGTTGTYLLDVSMTDVTTGITEVAQAGNIAVYPNPASDMLHIDVTGINAEHVLLSDVTGRVVLNMDADGLSDINMDVRNIASGNYTITVQAENVNITRKVVIK